MEIRLLGEFEVRIGGQRVELPRRQRTLLALLTMHAGHTVSADTLIDGIWGEELPARPRKSLQVAISSLRKTLGSAVEIETTAAGYRLSSADLDIDADRFERLVASGSDHSSHAQNLAEALALWSGDAYEGLESGVLMPEARRLQALRESAEDHHADLLVESDPASAVPLLERLVAADPLRERRWELLMRALYGSGRQTEALRSFSRARRVLAEELGLEPSPSLAALEQQILMHDPALGIVSDAPRDSFGDANADTRLAAILAADVAGYSSAMERSEMATYEAVRALRSEVDSIIRDRGGRIANTAGDSILAEFGSVVGATRSALAILERTRTFNAARSPDPPIQYRIGINLGDVIVDERGDLFGDGVNVAARLESIAPPGGICMSEAVHRSVAHRAQAEYQPLGETVLKNLRNPVRAWIIEPPADAGDRAVEAEPVFAPAAGVLLERQEELDLLEEAFQSAVGGSGRFVVVVGEAGIGKTALIERFVASRRNEAHMLWGACDDLLTPHALGPWLDIARQSGHSLRDAVTAGSLPAIFAEVVDLVTTAPLPTVIVIDDLHWADDATLDILTFVGRRLDQLRALVIVSVRDLGMSDPRIRRLLGEMGSYLNIEPMSLSQEGVADLVGEDVAAEIVLTTGGNPFFVTQIALHPGSAIPKTVTDSVLAAVARLSDAAVEVVERLSVTPGDADPWILGDIGSDPLVEAERAGLIHDTGRTVRFRHELARRAVEGSLGERRRKDLNANVLQRLVESGGEPGRIVHHAVLAGDEASIAEFAPRAAFEALRASAHHQAVDHFRRALDLREHYEDDRLAELLEGFAFESYTVDGDIDSGIRALTEAAAIRDRLGDRAGAGKALRLLSRLHWWKGNLHDATTRARQAIDLLEGTAETGALAVAQANLSQLAMLADDLETALRYGEEALAGAGHDDPETAANALINLGSARMRHGDTELGRRQMDRAIELAQTAGAEEPACRGLHNLTHILTERSELDEASHLAEELLRYATDHEQGAFIEAALVRRARIRLFKGDHEAAAGDLDSVTSDARPVRMFAEGTRSHLAVRVGDPLALTLIEDAWAKTEGYEPGFWMPVAHAAAEWMWLEDERPRWMLTALDDAVNHGVTVGRPHVGEFVMWSGLLGRRIPDRAMTPPVQAMLEGSWESAADQWAALGRRYEQALALGALATPGSLSEAKRILATIGALPLLRRIEAGRQII